MPKRALDPPLHADLLGDADATAPSHSGFEKKSIEFDEAIAFYRSVDR
jgi:hypothetical protein